MIAAIFTVAGTHDRRSELAASMSGRERATMGPDCNASAMFL
jgi:hypothetical protein